MSDKDTNGWMVTFSDLLTLLLTFFVLLISMSSMDKEKLKKSFEIFSSGLWILGPTSDELDTRFSNLVINKPIRPPNEFSDAEALVLNKIRNEMKGLKEFKGMNIKEDNRGIIIEFPDKILFDSGSVEINNTALPVLKKLGNFLAEYPCSALIEGHTDNIPISSGLKYRSNWELSVIRAVNVLKYILYHSNFPPGRISAVGYADIHPIVPNSTPGNRAKNRRVEIVIDAIDIL
ncbi:MAG: OmpA family protein [Thermodesulfobacteriota bacterium]|nr:OmpA family protein [Thermodesulfobacteriota bacterium]